MGEPFAIHGIDPAGGLRSAVGDLLEHLAPVAGGLPATRRRCDSVTNADGAASSGVCQSIAPILP